MDYPTDAINDGRASPQRTPDGAPLLDLTNRLSNLVGRLNEHTQMLRDTRDRMVGSQSSNESDVPDRVSPTRFGGQYGALEEIVNSLDQAVDLNAGAVGALTQVL